MKTLSVIVPVYCNAETLLILEDEFDKIDGELESMGVEMELIFVDDGSYDRSLDLLLEIRERRARSRVVKLTRNFGSISAVKTGFRYCTGDCFLAIAADLQDPVDRIPEMVRNWVEGVKYVLLVRRRRGDPIFSKFFSGIFNKLVRWLVFSDFPKGGFDVALMDATMRPYMEQSGKNVNPSLLSFYLGYEPLILYYDRDRRTRGTSKWNFFRKVNYFVDSLLGFSNKPMRVAGLVGLLVSLLSFTYGVLILTVTILEGSPVPGFPSLAALISFLCGTILFVTATIGEYVWRIFNQLDQRPEAVVEEVY